LLAKRSVLAVQTIVTQPRLAVDYIASFLGRLTSEEARQHYERYIGPYFASDGRVDLNVAQHAVATELGIPATAVAAATIDQMYRPVTEPQPRRQGRLDPQGPPCLFLAQLCRRRHSASTAAIRG
jgi:hypothetical protein